MEIGTAIKKAIKRKGITQTALANHLKITRQAVSAFCKNKTRPDFDKLVKIAQILDVSTDYLLTGKSYEYKSIREALNLTDKEIDNLKILLRTDFFKDLINDEKFINLFHGVISSFELNVSGMRNTPVIVNVHNEKMKKNDYFESVENMSALELFKFFQGFFKRINWIRSGKNPPQSVKES